MLSLIIKDFLIQKRIAALGALYIIIMTIALQNSSEGVYPASIIMLTYILTQTACAYDDKNKTDILINSLPVKRYSVVLARYISVFFYAAFSSIVYYLVHLLFNAVSFPIKSPPITPPGILGAILALSLITGLYYPIFFKLGYTKGKFYNMVIFFMVFFGIGGVSNIVISRQNIAFIESLTGIVNSLPELFIGILIILVSMVILLISYTISLYYYKKRDF